MSHVVRKFFRYSVIAACAAVVANGCMLDRRIFNSPGSVSPAQYCPGDTLTASYDFLRFVGGTCTGSAADCARFAPRVTMTSTPALFPATTRQNYADSISFTASGDRVDVSFAYGATSVFVPPSTLFENVRDNTDTATRIVGTLETNIAHMGECARGFARPTYMPIAVPGPPSASPNTALAQVCNPGSNGTAVNIVLNGGPAETFSATLAPGECLDTGAPGVPAFAASARSISAAPASLTCGPGGDGTSAARPPAPPLSTVVRQACR